ncbi:MAG: hypothetical protein NWS59_01930 [Ilumatobacteraceae bacterium]|nr:hypothetical protein [Ilumatobacteraceae bacterium]
MNFLLFTKFFLKLIAKGCIGGGQAVPSRCGERRQTIDFLSSRSRLNDFGHGHGKIRDHFDKARKSKIVPNLLTICAGRQGQQLGNRVI